MFPMWFFVGKMYYTHHNGLEISSIIMVTSLVFGLRCKCDICQNQARDVHTKFFCERAAVVTSAGTALVATWEAYTYMSPYFTEVTSRYTSSSNRCHSIWLFILLIICSDVVTVIPPNLSNAEVLSWSIHGRFSFSQVRQWNSLITWY